MELLKTLIGNQFTKLDSMNGYRGINLGHDNVVRNSVVIILENYSSSNRDKGKL